MDKRRIVDKLLGNTKLSLEQVLMVADLLTNCSWYSSGNAEEDTMRISVIVAAFISAY